MTVDQHIATLCRPTHVSIATDQKVMVTREVLTNAFIDWMVDGHVTPEQITATRSLTELMELGEQVAKATMATMDKQDRIEAERMLGEVKQKMREQVELLEAVLARRPPL